MSNFLLLLCLILLPSFGLTKSTARTLKYFNNNKYEEVKIVDFKDIEVDDRCAKLSSCAALKIANGKAIKRQESKAPTFGNPGASYCWDVGAKNRILKDANNNEYDFCVFPDGSMIDAWNLYYRHYPKQIVK